MVAAHRRADRYRGVRRREQAGFERERQPAAGVRRQRDQRVDHGAAKNAAPAEYSPGATSARSRYSLRISHEVSASSAQP